MKVSVVIPTHNRPALLAEALESVRAQQHSDLEIIVVDDGSECPLQLANYDTGDRQIRLLRNTHAEGPSGAKNRGMAAATGDVITFIDDDDLMAPQMLEVIVDVLTSHSELESVFINIDPFGTGAQGMRENQATALSGLLHRAGAGDLRSGLLTLGPNLFDALLSGLPMAFQRVAIRRKASLRVGPFREGRFDDLDWYFRVALRCRSALLTAPLYRFRCEGQSYFTHANAERQLADAIVRVHQHLATLPEIAGNAQRLTAVRRKLNNARLDKAFLAEEASATFPWADFFRSMSSGIRRSHLSLLLRTLLRGP